MRNTSTLEQLIGKTVSGFAVAERPGRSAEFQLFLVFSDGTSLEIWGDDFRPASGLDADNLEKVLANIENRGANLLACCPPPVAD